MTSDEGAAAQNTPELIRMLLELLRRFAADVEQAQRVSAALRGGNDVLRSALRDAVELLDEHDRELLAERHPIPLAGLLDDDHS